jgi:pyruvate kinase
LRRTKIVVTLGPSSETPRGISALIEAGADVVRLNQSHGTRQWHDRAFAAVRAASKRLGKPVAILVDLQGPKVRIGRVAGGRVELAAGATVDIVAGDGLGDARTLYTPLGELVRDVRPKDRVLIDDGNIILQVLARGRGRARCRVVAGGAVSDHKGINLPGVRLKIPALTAKDKDDLQWAVRSGAEYVAVSFVRTAADVRSVKDILHGLKSPIRVIAKIEKPEAVEAIDEIAAVSDGLMVARGDLGVEMPLEDVPVAQGTIIAAAHRKDIPAIVATQMLQSMTENPRPTRAEVSDVAGAIFGGTDAVMLSGETAAGKYPIESAAQMASIAEHSERYLAASGQFRPLLYANPVYSVTDAVCHGANSAARDLAASAVFVSTTTGRTALLFSKYRFPGVVVGASDDPAAVRRMALYWGVHPVPVRRCTNHHTLFDRFVKAALARQLVGPGDTVVFIAGSPLGRTGATNVLLVNRIPPRRAAGGAGVLRGRAPFGTITVDRDRCIKCGVCVGDCPAGIFEMPGGSIGIRREALGGCLGDWHCRDVCPAGAISVTASRGRKGAK